MQIQWFYVIHTNSHRMAQTKKELLKYKCFHAVYLLLWFDKWFFSFSPAHSLAHFYCSFIMFIPSQVNWMTNLCDDNNISISPNNSFEFLSYFYCCGIILLRAFLLLLSLESLANKYIMACIFCVNGSFFFFSNKTLFLLNKSIFYCFLSRSIYFDRAQMLNRINIFDWTLILIRHFTFNI